MSDRSISSQKYNRNIQIVVIIEQCVLIRFREFVEAFLIFLLGQFDRLLQIAFFGGEGTFASL